MKRLTNSLSLLVVLVGSAAAMAGSPIPLDRPTPPPCAADGICYPNVNEWGYYQVRWRRWPGHEFDAVSPEPTPAENLGPDLKPYEIPTPEKEDERAPPSTTKRPEATEIESETLEEGTAPLDSFEQLDRPTQPAYPAPLPPSEEPLDPNREPTSEIDPPPAPPFAFSSPVPGSEAATPSGLESPRRASNPRGATDPPPQAPWAHSASL